ncbi:MAG: GGDEF domain-containing protein [Candidatus Limiplasma sp.]|nr:GGDEF domain-containing protein [Candidatus Limiplasma sp.]
MPIDNGPLSIRGKADRNTGYWCRKVVSVCYITIIINLLVLIAFWYFFALGKVAHDPLNYWLRYIILPTSLMLSANIAADLLVRAKRVPPAAKKYVSIILPLFFCTLLCMRYNILAVLLTAYLVPIMLSTLFADVKLTRLTWFLAQLLLIPSGLRMYASSTRGFGPWIWAEMLTASGLLLASYFLAKILIIYGRDTASNLNSMEEELKLDPLTNLYNRKAYDEYVPRMMEECRLSNMTLSIAVLDIDDFKQINDIHGHTAGDRVLLRFAAELREIVHRNIYAFRIGGEEFVLLFQGYSVREAAKVCEDTLSAIRVTSMPELDGHTVTFSGGVAEMRDHETDPTELFKVADAALYSAKQSGKNKIVVQNSPMA